MAAENWFIILNHITIMMIFALIDIFEENILKIWML